MSTVSMMGTPGRRNCAHTGVATFLRSPYCDAIEEISACWAVFGVPYDEGSPFAPGSRFGPRHIREQSLRFRGNGVFDSDTGVAVLRDFVARGQIVDVGDVDIFPGFPERSFEGVTDTVRRIRARGAKPIGIGGDHAVTYAIVRAFETPLHVVQIDAHLDYMRTEGGFQYSNGQGFRKIHGLETVVSLTQIGIRGLRNSESDFADAAANGSTIVTMGKLRRDGIGAAIAHLPPGTPCYVSIDIDAYDMALTPGCVSAESNGITFEQMTELLGTLARRVEVMGFDLVEVNPMLDVATGATSYLAAETMVRFLGALDLDSNAAIDRN